MVVLRNAYWSAFTFTAAAGLFLTSGVIGYNLDKHDRFVAGTAWPGHVIWWEVWIGVAITAVAAWFWRSALHGHGTTWSYGRRHAHLSLTIVIAILALMLWGALRG